MIIRNVGPWKVHDSRIMDAHESDALQKASALHTALQRDAARSRQRLADTLRRARARARRVGLQLGKDEGMRRVLAAFAQDTSRWSEAGRRIESAVEAAIDAMLGAVPRSALMIAQVRRCFNEARDEDLLRIHVNEVDFAMTRDVVADLARETDMACGEIIKANYLLPGSCLVETRNGMIDGSVERQLLALRECVRERFKRTDLSP